MERFLEHSTLELTEALNNPQEYYMTDDTKMPNSIIGAFDIDGNNYIMSLQQTSDVGIYILEVGKTGSNGGKTYWWKFHTPKDIMPVLATMLHFTQASASFLGPKMKGIAVQFKQGASDQMVRATKLAERIIKRSYIKSFNVIPVSQPAITSADKYYHQKVRFLFIGKKGIPTSTLFGGKTFKKYDFDGKTAPAEAIAELEPKKIKKATNTLKPSTKYSFGQFNVDTPIDPEFLNQVKQVQHIDKESEEPETNVDEYEKALKAAKPASIPESVGMIRSIPAFGKLVSALEKHGYDESKLDWGNLNYVIGKVNPGTRALLASMNMDNPQGTSSQRDNWIAVMKKIAGPNSDWDQKLIAFGAQKAVKFGNKYSQGAPTETDKASSNKAIVKKSNINPTELVATMPGSGIVVNFYGDGFEEVDGSWEKKKHHIEYELGYKEAVGNLKTISNVVSYSGHKFTEYNNPLRETIGKLFAGEKLSNSEIKTIASSYGKYQKLFRAFNDIKPLPESLWVYRGTHIPKGMKQNVVPGYDFVDPAFLSTSLKPNIPFGYDKMRIFLPKGSKVVPILNHSNHQNEAEILLPPASIIKVVEVETVSGAEKLGIQGIFTGSPFKSITAMLKKQLSMAEDYDSIRNLKEFIMEQESKEKNEQYDAEGKFGGDYDYDLAKLINAAVKNGKIKVDAPKDK